MGWDRSCHRGRVSGIFVRHHDIGPATGTASATSADLMAFSGCRYCDHGTS